MIFVAFETRAAGAGVIWAIDNLRGQSPLRTGRSRIGPRNRSVGKIFIIIIIINHHHYHRHHHRHHHHRHHHHSQNHHDHHYYYFHYYHFHFIMSSFHFMKDETSIISFQINWINDALRIFDSSTGLRLN